MRYSKHLQAVSAVLLLSAAITCDTGAKDDKEPAKETGAKAEQKKPNEADMMAMMMEMGKPGENHKHLQEMAGTWSYTVKFWMDPDAAPSESSGMAVTRTVMGGRYVISDITGKMQMPGPDGKMMDMEFVGMAIEGYDKAKKKFVSSWIDNMGTGIMNSEGTYDSATKTLTYYAEYEPMPGMKTKAREALKIPDRDHHTMEFFEERGGKEVKTMEIAYTRKK